MGIFFSLFSGALSCIFYGFVITAFVIATLYFLLSMASNGIVRSPAFFISFFILAILLWVNMSVMVGAFQVKSATNAMELRLNQIVEGYYGYVDIQESQEIGDMLDEEFPILNHYLNLFNWSGNSYEDLPELVASGINRQMNQQIWSNILWSLGFIVAAVLISLYFDRGETQVPYRRGRPAYATNNRTIINRPRHGKPHLNRNRRNRL